MLAQLNKENGRKQLYLGLDTFIAMSAGLPRALLTTLRSIFEWSIFQGEDPLRNGMVSVEAQYRGVRDATAWFFDHMRKAGDEGASIQRAIGRLGQLFRVSRFGERPIEVSLSAFSLDPNVGSVEAHRVLRLAEERSFLVSVPDGGKDKNSGDPLLKYQISPMLAPRWDLPIARRGTVTLTEKEFNAVFHPDGVELWSVLDDWIALEHRCPSGELQPNLAKRSSSDGLHSPLQGKVARIRGLEPPLGYVSFRFQPERAGSTRLLTMLQSAEKHWILSPRVQSRQRSS